MSESQRDVDAVFKGAGARAGLEIWCVENLRLVPVAKSFHGKFYSGSAYLILNTVSLKSGVAQHELHYWLGKDAKEVDSAMVSDKAVELDMFLGSHAVQYREIQGSETEKFLSYFKPCIIPIEGIFSSEMLGSGNKTRQARLFACKGDHVVYVKEVPFARSSLNHNDVFILDTESKIFLFSGCNSNIQERAKALDVIQFIQENYHGGKSDVATIEDGKFVGDSDVGEFWSFFGGYAPIMRDSPNPVQEKTEIPYPQLFWISKEKMCWVGNSSLSTEMLVPDKCFMLDCDNQIFVWMGRNTTISERKKSISSTENFVASQGRSTSTHITFLTDGSETTTFSSHFDGWSQTPESTLYEEGRGKVAALFKQKGFDVKELPDNECEPFIDCTGILKVWRVDGHDVSLVPVTEHGKLFSGDSYIVQYVYPGEAKDEILFYAWLGNDSVMEDRMDAIALMCSMADSTKGHSILAQVCEGKEPIQFFFIFRSLIVFKGGMSSGYKRFKSENSTADEISDESEMALFRIQGSSAENMQAIQVDPVSASLNSSYCYILQVRGSIFTWIGNICSPRDHELLDRMLDLLYPTAQTISVREGGEPDSFWDALGGKAEYSKEKDMKQWEEDPHMFTCTFTEGDLKVKEVFDFTQDDLATEEVLVLDCCHVIYVWVGLHSELRSKQEALSLGKRFLELDILHEGLNSSTPLYIIAEGQEPSFFTRFFVWDSSKAYMQGSSFERKLAILKGQGRKVETPTRSPSDATPNSSKTKAAILEGSRRRSWSPAPRAFSPLPQPQNSSHTFSPTPVVRKLFTSPSNQKASSHEAAPEGSVLPPIVTEEMSSSSEQFGAISLTNSHAEVLGETKIFPYERLKVTSDNPVTGIDVTKRETYLSDEEFREKFDMTKEAFYRLPKWRQDKQKMSLSLF